MSISDFSRYNCSDAGLPVHCQARRGVPGWVAEGCPHHEALGWVERAEQLLGERACQEVMLHKSELNLSNRNRYNLSFVTAMSKSKIANDENEQSSMTNKI